MLDTLEHWQEPINNHIINDLGKKLNLPYFFYVYYKEIT